MASGTAFGEPGITRAWTSSVRDLVTSALGLSRVWATVGHGILNEVYWPASGRPQIRDLGLARVVHEGDCYGLALEFLPDPLHDVVLVSYGLEPDGLRLYPLLAPHLDGDGRGDAAWARRDGLFARKGAHAVCLYSGGGFLRGSAGYVGRPDGWQDFAANGAMTYSFAGGGPRLVWAPRRRRDRLALLAAGPGRGAWDTRLPRRHPGRALAAELLPRRHAVVDRHPAC